MVVIAVVAVLAGYFAYRAWPGPERAIRQRLDALSETLTVPEHEEELGRAARIAQLRHYFAEDVRLHVSGSQTHVTSREALLGAVRVMVAPPGGWTVEFADILVSVDSDSTARVQMTANLAARESFDSFGVTLAMVKADDEWVIAEAQATAKEPATPARQ